jgi:membrane-associated protease RseP (regulator of RpoE activity)
MRRTLLGLALAGLLAAPVAVLADPPPSPSPHSHEYHWSFSSGRGRLGVAILGLGDELRQHFGAPADRGLMVAHVEPGSAAAAAGVQVGDIITTVAGQPARDVTDVISALGQAKRGDKVAVEVVRDGKPIKLDATMTDDPMPMRMMQGTPDSAVPGDQHDFEDMRRQIERDFQQMMQDMPWSHDGNNGNNGNGNNGNGNGTHGLRHGSGVDT